MVTLFKNGNEKPFGALAALALHVLVFLAVFYFLGAPARVLQTNSQIITIMLSPLNSKIFAPGRPAERFPRPAKPKPPAAAAEAKAPTDELQTRLNELARLTEAPSAAQRAFMSGEGNSSGGSPYNVKDLIRAQVLRHWSLDLSAPGAGSFSVQISLVINRNGKVLSADIVDQDRFKKDPVFRNIALSLRNAVLLSSPFLLPFPGTADETKITLNLNPRETQR